MTEDEKETKVKAHPDYTASAVSLTNTPQVKDLLDEWQAAKELAVEAVTALNEVTEKLPERIKAGEAQGVLTEARKNLEAAVISLGGYQDVEAGLYALQQVRKQIIYDPDKVKELIPVYADKILVQVDGNVLKGLIRGKLVTAEQAEQCQIVKETKLFVIGVD